MRELAQVRTLWRGVAAPPLLEVAAKQLALRAACALEERAHGSCWGLGRSLAALALKLGFLFPVRGVFARAHADAWFDCLVATVEAIEGVDEW